MFRIKRGVLVSALFLTGVGLVMELAHVIRLISAPAAYALLSVLLVAGATREVFRTRAAYPSFWLLNPLVLCILLMFVLSYGVTNAIFFLPFDVTKSVGILPGVSSAMVAHEFMALVALVAMVLGYWSPVARRLSGPSAVTLVNRRLLPRGGRPKLLVLPALVAIAIGARLVAIHQGFYGYGSAYGHLLGSTNSYSQYVKLAEELGQIALVLGALNYFAPGKTQQGAGWFWLILAMETFFGVLSGFKSQVVMPFVIVGVCFYVQRRTIPKRWILTAVLAVIVAYGIIQPFRTIRNESAGPLDSVAKIMNAFGEASDLAPENRGKDFWGSVLAIGTRLNLSYIGSFGIQYADSQNGLPPGSPDFAQDLLLSPLYAVVPRFIWTIKPKGDVGQWYTTDVLGIPVRSSTAMGPVAYLYFVGGYAAVILGFFALGVVQRITFSVLRPWKGSAGTVIFFILLPTMVHVSSAVDAVVVTLIRNTLLGLVLVHLTYKSVRRGPRKGTEHLSVQASYVDPVARH